MGGCKVKNLMNLERTWKKLRKKEMSFRVKIVSIEKLFEENNAMIRGWMDNINRQSMPPSFEETGDEDETQPPSQPLNSHQGNFIILYIF